MLHCVQAQYCVCGGYTVRCFTGELYAQCPVEEYPSIAVESVLDSSRYFVIRIKDPSGVFHS